MKLAEKQARECLSKLVEYVFGHRDGLINGVTYQNLALWIGRIDKHGQGHAHGMGFVLGRMGHLLKGIEGEWGEEIPHLQSLVVQKAGAYKGLPDEGIKEFWPTYPAMSREEKINRVKVEHERIVDFGSRWNDVLVKLGLPQLITNERLEQGKSFGGGGESPQHKQFKKFVSEHPEIVGAQPSWKAIIEYALPSLDQIDVVFKSPDVCIAVEVKSSVSDSFPYDYERGLYQTIKYAALLKAMVLAGKHDIPSTIHSVLVLESALPNKFRKLAEILGVIVYEKVREKKDDRTS